MAVFRFLALCHQDPAQFLFVRINSVHLFLELTFTNASHDIKVLQPFLNIINSGQFAELGGMNIKIRLCFTLGNG